MKSSLLPLAMSTVLASAEDLLFPQTTPNFNLVSDEWNRAQALNISTKLVELDEWYKMTTEDFSQYKAIVIADAVSSDRTLLNFLNDTKAVWSPAVKGNMIAIGTDPTNHCCSPGSGAETLIDNALQFAADGTTPDGTPQTGLYMALGWYYESPVSIEDGYVESLSYFGNFTMRSAGCYNDVHIVASSPALGTLTDESLSNWSCSIHEAFLAYPAGFQALAIARGITGPGSETFGDSFGLPYIISRGATPASCGNGIWDVALKEDCDDGNIVDGDGCDRSCNCEPGYLSDGNGQCLAITTTSEAPGCPAPPPTSSVKSVSSTSASLSSSVASSSASGYPYLPSVSSFSTSTVPEYSSLEPSLSVSSSAPGYGHY